MEKKWFSYVLVENIEGRFHHRITICEKVVATLSLTTLTIFLTTELICLRIVR